MRDENEPAQIVICLPLGDATEALDRAVHLLWTGRRVVVVLDSAHSADVGTVGALARAVQTARRHGGVLVVEAPGPAMQRLVDLMGLSDVLPGESPSAASGQPQR